MLQTLLSCTFGKLARDDFGIPSPFAVSDEPRWRGSPLRRRHACHDVEAHVYADLLLW